MDCAFINVSPARNAAASESRLTSGQQYAGYERRSVIEVFVALIAGRRDTRRERETRLETRDETRREKSGDLGAAWGRIGVTVGREST